MLNKKETEYAQLLSQKKSSEVQLGFISEKLAPFLKDFPVADPSKLQFLGQPIDYIYFGDEEIIFIEVKSGNSRLSKSQKSIQALIDTNKIKFLTYRIK